MISVKRFLFVSFFSACLFFPQQSPAQTTPEYRGLWMTRFEWPKSTQAATQSYISTAFQDLKNGKFNSVFFQIRGSCETLYPSPYEPWGQQFNWTNPGYDPVAFAVTDAHAKDLEFHAYINTHGIFQTNASLVVPPHTTPEHPFWLYGNPSVRGSDDWCFVDSTGTTQPLGAGEDRYVWASPGVPAFNAWTRKQIVYVAETYNVDGVHYDRIRAAGTGSHDPISKRRQADPQTNPGGLAYQAWTTDQINRLCNDVYGAIAEINANRGAGKRFVKVSSAPFPHPPSQLPRNQDVNAWTALGAMDFVVPQTYTTSLSTFTTYVTANMAVANGRHMTAALHRNRAGMTMSIMFDQLREARRLGAHGTVAFSYTGHAAGELASYATNVYNEYVATPGMPWITSPTDAIIVGNVIGPNGLPVEDAQIGRAGTTYKWLTGSDGFYAMLKVPVGVPLVLTCSKPGLPLRAVNVPALTAGSVTRIDIQMLQSAGSVSFDKEQYKENETALITLADIDLAGNGEASVAVDSTTETPGELVTLTETLNQGIFSGSIQVQPGAPAADGILQVSDNDVITVRYQDADNGLGAAVEATDTATADTAGPVITNVSVQSISSTGATITFNTSEPADALVRYSTACGQAGSVSTVSSMNTVHSVSLINLSPGTDHFFTIEATDDVGHVTTADNGGNCFTFRTIGIPTGLNENFDSNPSGWTATGLWHLASTNDPCASSNSAPAAYYYGNAACNYETGARTLGSLKSPTFLMPEQAELTLYSREQTEDIGTSWDVRKIFLNTPAGRFQIHQSTNRADAWYKIGPLDLASYAGQQVVLEFEFDSVDSLFNAFRGWYVDDVQVLSRIPSIANLQCITPINEAELTTLTGTVVDSNTNDAFLIMVSWGDNTVEMMQFENGPTTFELTHRYLDDDPTGTSSDTYSIGVMVMDSSQRQSSSSTDVTVNNAAPLVLDLTATDAIIEGQTATVSYRLFDQGTRDTLATHIEWGDGTQAIPDAQVINGQTVYTAQHVYPDDNPSGTSSDIYEIRIVATDDDGGTGIGTWNLAVDNVSPVLSNVAITSSVEGGTALLSGFISDAGIQDTFTLSINWGDGSSPQVYPGIATGNFQHSHVYQDNGTYLISVTVLDDDNGEVSAQINANVSNVAPQITTLTPGPASEGEISSVHCAFVDLGNLDDFSVSVNWGDGSAVDTTPLAAGTSSFHGTHVYANNGSYTVTVTVTDKDGGSDQATAVMHITNSAPSIVSAAVSNVSENGVAVLNGTFSDAGTQDSFTLEVNWGDSSAPQVVSLPAASNSFNLSHQYLDDNPSGTPADTYPVQVTITDSAGASDQLTASSTVTNVAPVLSAVAANHTGGGTVQLTGSVADVSPLDTFRLTIVWGDGVSEEIQIGAGGGAFVQTHTYETRTQQTITVSLADDDGGVVSITTEVDVTSRADIILAKTATPDPVQVGNAISYNIIATNAGPDNATNVVLTDTLPSQVQFNSADNAGCVAGAGIVTCTLGTLASGTSASVLISVTAIQAGVITNSASVSATETDPVPENNIASITSTVNPADPGSGPGPDLTGSFAGVNFVCLPAQGLEFCSALIRFVSVNQGDQKTKRFTTRFFISDDSVFDGGDRAFARRGMRLRPGQARQISTVLLPRPAAEARGKFLIVVIDSGNKIAESNETNNIVVFGPLE